MLLKILDLIATNVKEGHLIEVYALKSFPWTSNGNCHYHSKH